MKEDCANINCLYIKILKSGYTIGDVKEIFNGAYTIALRAPYTGTDELQISVLLCLFPHGYKEPTLEQSYYYE